MEERKRKVKGIWKKKVEGRQGKGSRGFRKRIRKGKNGEKRGGWWRGGKGEKEERGERERKGRG